MNHLQTSVYQNNLGSLRNSCCPEILIVDDIDYNRMILSQIISYIFELDYMEAVNGKEC